MKNRLLFLIQLPPPVHGASLMNQYIKLSSLVNSSFDCIYFDISPETIHRNVGKFSFIKILRVFLSYLKILIIIFQKKPKFCYFTLSPVGFAFYKDVLYVAILKIFRIKIIYHLHGKGIANNSNYLNNFLYKYVFLNCDVIHLSNLLLHDISSFRNYIRDIHILPNGIPNIAPVISRINNDKKVKVIFLSNLIESKGAHVLIDALRFIPSTYLNILEISIAGGGNSEYVQLLKENATKNSNYKVNFLGPVYGNEKKSLLESADIFVLPTSYANECLPISILEAMQFGLAICSTREGAISEIVSDSNGFIFSPSEPKDLANALIRLIDDSTLLQECQRNSRLKYLEKYTFDIFEVNLLKILNDFSKKN